MVGDLSAAGSSPVTWWAGNWSALNSLSGGNAPAGFMGFEASGQLSCGTNWSAPASLTPPSSVPSYMAVAVSSSISYSGGRFVGNTVHIVVVQFAPGYSQNPSHHGTGTVVATLC